MKIIWTIPALNDLENLHKYIAQDSEKYADIFINKIIDTVEKASNLPNIGRIVPERNEETIREIIFQNYRIIYKIFENSINIVTVCHGSRNLSTWKDDNIFHREDA